MPSITRTVTTSAPADVVFAYLADFTNATEWDSGTQSCELIAGDGGPGTTYRNVSRFAGRDVELTYTVERNNPPEFVIVGSTPTTTSRDTIIVRQLASGGTAVDYLAEFTFSGMIRFLTPVMVPLLEKLGNDTEKTLKAALDKLADSR